MTLMSMIGKLNYAGEKNTIDILSQIWNSVANTIENCEGRQLDILSEFVSKLFDAMEPETIQDDMFFTVGVFLLSKVIEIVYPILHNYQDIFVLAIISLLISLNQRYQLTEVYDFRF